MIDRNKIIVAALEMGMKKDRIDIINPDTGKKMNSAAFISSVRRFYSSNEDLKLSVKEIIERELS